MFKIKTFCFSHNVEEILKDKLVSPKFPLLSLTPQSTYIVNQLVWLSFTWNSIFERVLKSLGPQRGGNKWILFSWKSFATSCGEYRECSVHSLFSLVAGPLLGNGKLNMFLVTKLSLTWRLCCALQCTHCWLHISYHAQVQEVPRRLPHSSVLCICLSWSHPVPSSHLPSLKSSLIMPG